MARREYSPEEKATVMAALLAGQSISEVAARYRIPRGTVASWSRELGRDHSISNTKKEQIGELVVGYLEENLVTLRAQVKVFRDANWLKEQDASQLAVLHGVLTDKAIRLLEALAGDEEGDEGGAADL